MLLHGDELGRTQQGNNNGYAQDNELTWVHWDLDPSQQDLLAFTQRLVQLRREHPVFRRRRFFAGSADHGGESEIGDIAWFEPDGDHMDETSWANGLARSMMVFLNGSAIPESDVRGQPILDDSFLVVFNGADEAADFLLPQPTYGEHWTTEIDTAAVKVATTTFKPGDSVTAQPRSVVVLRCARLEPAGAPSGVALARR
jgi:glycogen operon protein